MEERKLTQCLFSLERWNILYLLIFNSTIYLRLSRKDSAGLLVRQPHLPHQREHVSMVIRSGYAPASHFCDSGSIPVVTVSCGLLLVLSLLRWFFSRFSGFPPFTRTNTSKFQFDLDVKRLKHELLARD